MKKFLFFLLCFICFTNVKAENIVGQQETEYYYHVFVNDTWVTNKLYFLTVDGKAAYCMKINTHITGSQYEEVDHRSLNFTTNELKLIELYAYYGYGYNDNFDIMNYMAVQQMIWEKQGQNVFFTRTPSRTEGWVSIDYYRNEILNKIIVHNEIPYFGAYDFDFAIGTDRTLYALNNHLNNYDLVYTGPNIILKDSEKLTIKGYTVGYDSLILRKQNVGGEIRLFKREGSQDIMTFSGLQYDFDYDIKLNFIFYPNNLCYVRFDPLFNIYDNSFSGTLENARYEVYDLDFNLVYEFGTDYNGRYCTDGLSLGDYIIKEISPSKGYYLNDNYIYFNLSYGSAINTVYLDAYRIEADVKLNLIFEGTDETPTTIFHLYKNGNYLFEFMMSSGSAVVELEYGNYFFRQVNELEDYDTMEDIYFSVLSQEDINIYHLYELRKEEESEDNEEEPEDKEEEPEDKEEEPEDNEEEKLEDNEEEPEDNEEEPEDNEEEELEDNEEDEVEDKEEEELEANNEDEVEDNEEQGNNDESEIDMGEKDIESDSINNKNPDNLNIENQVEVIDEVSNNEKLPQLGTKIAIIPFFIIFVLLCLKKKLS